MTFRSGHLNFDPQRMGHNHFLVVVVVVVVAVDVDRRVQKGANTTFPTTINPNLLVQ